MEQRESVCLSERRTETGGLARCCRLEGHVLPHRSEDGREWVAGKQPELPFCAAISETLKGDDENKTGDSQDVHSQLYGFSKCQSCLGSAFDPVTRLPCISCKGEGRTKGVAETKA